MSRKPDTIQRSHDRLRSAIVENAILVIVRGWSQREFLDREPLEPLQYRKRFSLPEEVDNEKLNFTHRLSASLLHYNEAAIESIIHPADRTSTTGESRLIRLAWIGSGIIRI